MKEHWKKNIILFLASQIVSLFGSMLVQYAVTWYITLKTQSGVMMTISIICGFLPMFFISPFAGVWADRYNRKLLIILSDLMTAVSTLVLAILFYMGYESLWLLFVISAIRALGSGVQAPAVSAFIPQIVPEDQLTKVNATNGSIQSLAMIVAPILSGALLYLAPIENIFFIDVATAAVAIFILSVMLNVPAHAKALAVQKNGYFNDMKEGYLYIKNHRFIRVFFLYSSIFFIFISPAAFLTPLQVTRSFGGDVWRLTSVEIAFSGGTMLGGLLMLSWGGLKNKVHTMVLANLVLGACTVAIGVVPIFAVYLLMMVITGIAVPIYNTPATVLLQQKVEPDFLGRVFGVMSMISSIMMPAGMLIFGPVSDFIRIEWLLIGTGILLFAQGIAIFKTKVLVDAGRIYTENTPEQ